MSLNVASSIYNSKRLTYRSIIFYYKPFNVKNALDVITTSKKIDPSLIYTCANLSLSLGDLNTINVFIAALETNRKQPYNPLNAAHMQMLTSLWCNMFPDESYPGQCSAVWGNLGFQGIDPATDFRGMGILGLSQLVFFSHTDPVECKRVLALSAAGAYFPFAAVSINVTAFCVDLLLEGRLHGEMLDAIAAAVLLSPTSTSTSTSIPSIPHTSITILETYFHTLYSSLYRKFAAAWVEGGARGVMDFPRVWGDYRQGERRKRKHVG